MEATVPSRPVPTAPTAFPLPSEAPTPPWPTVNPTARPESPAPRPSNAIPTPVTSPPVPTPRSARISPRKPSGDCSDYPAVNGCAVDGERGERKGRETERVWAGYCVEILEDNIFWGCDGQVHERSLGGN